MADTCCSFSTYLFGASEIGSYRDLEGMSNDDQAGSVEEAAIAARRSMLRRPSERRLSDGPLEGGRENLGGSNGEHVRHRRRSCTNYVLDGVNREHVQCTTPSGSNFASDRLAKSSSFQRPRLSSLRSFRHRSSGTEGQSGQPISPQTPLRSLRHRSIYSEGQAGSPRTPLLEKVCEKASERETNEEEPVPEKELTIIARETGTHLPEVSQSRTQGDRVHNDEHVAGIAGVLNLGKGLQQPPLQPVRKKDQSELLSRRGCMAPTSLQIDRSGGDGTAVPKQNPSCEAKPFSRGGTPPPAEEMGTPAKSVLPQDKGLVPSTSASLASQPMTLPPMAATSMGSSVSSAARGIQMPALRDLRGSALMRRRSTSSSAAATKQGKGASNQAQSDAVPVQQQQPPAQMEKATGSGEAANAAATLVQTALGHRLQPRPPPEDARRLVKERPRPWQRGLITLA